MTSSQRLSGACAIAGLGMTRMGRVYDRTAADFAADACRRAIEDAGIPPQEVDGLLTSTGLSGGVGLGLQRDLGLHNLKLLSEMNAYGATAGCMVQFAAMAIISGMAKAVLCVFADAPLAANRRASDAYGAAAYPTSGWAGLLGASGVVGATAKYALATRRHMLSFGTTSQDLGEIAVAQREWASMNELAQFRECISLEDHQNSRWIANPLHLLDCCVVSNGGIAILVTSSETAQSLRQAPSYILGWGQSHPGHYLRRDKNFGLVTGAARSGPVALRMAGLSVKDVDIAELYDCYTYTVLVSLEDYGFCGKGEGGDFVSDGRLRPGRSDLSVNTGGGQLSSYYMWGMTPLSEAVIQSRSAGGARQANRNDVILVSGNGGTLDHHSTLILSPHQR